MVENSIYDAVVNDRALADLIISTDINGLDLIPSSIDLVGAEIELVQRLRREYIVKEAIEKSGKAVSS